MCHSDVSFSSKKIKIKKEVNWLWRSQLLCRLALWGDRTRCARAALQPPVNRPAAEYRTLRAPDGMGRRRRAASFVFLREQRTQKVTHGVKVSLQGRNANLLRKKTSSSLVVAGDSAAEQQHICLRRQRRDANDSPIIQMYKVNIYVCH